MHQRDTRPARISPFARTFPLPSSLSLFFFLREILGKYGHICKRTMGQKMAHSCAAQSRIYAQLAGAVSVGATSNRRVLLAFKLSPDLAPEEDNAQTLKTIHASRNYCNDSAYKLFHHHHARRQALHNLQIKYKRTSLFNRNVCINRSSVREFTTLQEHYEHIHAASHEAQCDRSGDLLLFCRQSRQDVTNHTLAWAATRPCRPWAWRTVPRHTHRNAPGCLLVNTVPQSVRKHQMPRAHLATTCTRGPPGWRHFSAATL